MADFEEEFKKILETIRLYPKQLVQAWEEVSELEIPEDYKDVDNVVFSGMGGSALGARMIDAFAKSKRMRVPFEIVNQYHLPEFAGKRTLAVISSYSGNTEETISCFHEAHLKGAKIFVITTGGKLKDLALEAGVPSYIFSPKYNPSSQPRMSTAYAAGAALALFSKLSLLPVRGDEIQAAEDEMESVFSEVSQKEAGETNIAHALYKKIAGTIPVLVASEHLYGVCHALKNSFNENAKTFALLFDIPELNHHLMEGLANPREIRPLIHFVFIESDLYSDRVQRRYPLTQEVVAKNSIAYSIYRTRAETRLAQVFELLVLGSMVIYYLTESLNIDPTAIPWVDYFKENLK